LDNIALNNLGNYTGSGSILYYNKALAIDPKDTFALTNKDVILHMLGNNTSSTESQVATSTYDNRNYGIQIQYPFDWTVQESKSSAEPINVATFVSPTGSDPDPTADVAICIDRLHNSTTDLDNYAHFVAFTDYENLHIFMLLDYLN